MTKVINTDELAKSLQLVYDILNRRANNATDAAVRSQSPIIAEKADAYQTAAFLLDGFCSSAGLFLKKSEPASKPSNSDLFIQLREAEQGRYEGATERMYEHNNAYRHFIHQTEEGNAV